MTVIGCVPIYNNADTVAEALASLRDQSEPLTDILLVDDGSQDGGGDVSNLTVLRHETNMGRGAARATALGHAKGDLLLFCDATCALHSEFLRRSMRWFEDSAVAAVFGRIWQPPGGNAVQRWRARHLFKQESLRFPIRGALLATTACIVRVSAVREVGGFNPKMRALEDADLGRRLLARGYDVIGDPGLQARPLKDNSLGQVLERYARWNHNGRMDLVSYLRLVSYSIKGMALEDLRARDPAAALISLICPHYQALMAASAWTSPKVLGSDGRQMV